MKDLGFTFLEFWGIRGAGKQPRNEESVRRSSHPADRVGTTGFWPFGKKMHLFHSIFNTVERSFIREYSRGWIMVLTFLKRILQTHSKFGPTFYILYYFWAGRNELLDNVFMKLGLLANCCYHLFTA